MWLPWRQAEVAYFEEEHGLTLDRLHSTSLLKSHLMRKREVSSACAAPSLHSYLSELLLEDLTLTTAHTIKTDFFYLFVLRGSDLH